MAPFDDYVDVEIKAADGSVMTERVHLFPSSTVVRIDLLQILMRLYV
jgi:hypothetical protein